VTIVKPSLRVAKTATRKRVRAGGIVNVRDPGDEPVEAGGAGRAYLRPAAGGAGGAEASPKVRVSDGRYCWTAKRVAAGIPQRYEITVRALLGATGRTVNVATVNGAGVRGTARASRAVRILPRQVAGGGVTG
jgi:hypothetical protein